MTCGGGVRTKGDGTITPYDGSYGITARELHRQIIESLRSWAEHMQIVWGPAGNPMDTESRRPLEQTISCVLHRAIETFRSHHDPTIDPMNALHEEYCDYTQTGINAGMTFREYLRMRGIRTHMDCDDSSNEPRTQKG